MIELGKQYQTRGDCGHVSKPVRIICLDGPHPTYPVVGVIGVETEVNIWTAIGQFVSTGHREPALDLIPVPTKHEGWIAIDRNGFVPRQYVQSDKSLISRGVADALVPVTWES